MIMTSHILFKNIDPDWPATLSQKFLKSLLRDILKFEGLIVTDDLGMKALANHHPVEKIPVRAIEAGADLLLYCNEPDSPPKAIEAITKAAADGTLPPEKVTSIYRRILEHKREHIKLSPLSKEAALAIVGTQLHKDIAAKMK